MINNNNIKFNKYLNRFYIKIIIILINIFNFIKIKINIKKIINYIF
jgi:hypothetical protein